MIEDVVYGQRVNDKGKTGHIARFVQDGDTGLEFPTSHQVQIVVFCDLGQGAVDEANQDRLDDVGVHKGAFVAKRRGDGDQRLDTALFQVLHIASRECIGDHGLAPQVVRRKAANVGVVTGDDVRLVKVPDATRRAQILLKTNRAELAVRGTAECRQYQIRIPLQLSKGAQGERQVQMKNGIAKEDLVGECAKHLGHTIAIDARDDKHTFVTKDTRLLLGYLTDGPALQSVPEVNAIHDGRGLRHASDLLDLLVDVGAGTDSEVHVHPTEANGIHLSIKLGDQFARPLHVAVRSITPNVHLLAE